MVWGFLGFFCSDLFSWPNTCCKTSSITHTRHVIPYLLHAESQSPHELDMQTCTFSKHFLPHFLLPLSPLTVISWHPFPDHPYPSALWLSGLRCRPPLSPQFTRLRLLSHFPTHLHREGFLWAGTFLTCLFSWGWWWASCASWFNSPFLTFLEYIKILFTIMMFLI